MWVIGFNNSTLITVDFIAILFIKLSNSIFKDYIQCSFRTIVAIIMVMDMVVVTNLVMLHEQYLRVPFVVAKNLAYLVWC